MRKTTIGMTLIEVTVTMVIVSLLTGALLWMALAGKTMWQSSVTRSSSRQDLQVASWRIAQEIRNTNIDLITNNTSATPRAFAFLSAYDSSGNFITDANGAPVWQKCVIYYLPDNTNRLLRREVYGAFSTAITPVQLAGYCDGSGTQISAAITALNLAINQNDKSVSLTLGRNATSQHGKVDQQSRTITVLLRN